MDGKPEDLGLPPAPFYEPDPWCNHCAFCGAWVRGFLAFCRGGCKNSGRFSGRLAVLLDDEKGER